MWPKFCLALVTKYALLSQQNLEPLCFILILDILPLYTSNLLLCCDNIKDWSITTKLCIHGYFYACEREIG